MTTTAAPSVAPTASAPPQAGSAFGFSLKGMSGEVLGFVRAADVANAASTVDFDIVSTIAFFSLGGRSDGSIDTEGAAWRVWNSTDMDRLIARAHAAGTKVVMTLEDFAWDPASTAVTSALLGSTAARERLAEATAAEVARRGVDGVNVDFEPIPAGEATEFTDFVRRLRTQLDADGPGLQLTADVIGHYDSYDIRGLVAPGGVNAIYLMGYHYAGWWSQSAGSTAPYGGGGYDVEQAIKGLLGYMSPNRLIVGVPYYGHMWPTVSGAPFARTSGQGVDLVYSDAIAVARAHGLGYLATEHTAWSAFETRDCPTCAPHWEQLYFDDATSLAAKWAYLASLHLLGTGVWTLPFGGGDASLDAAMRAAFLPR